MYGTSLGTTSSAAVQKTTNRPSPLIDAAPESTTPFTSAPSVRTLLERGRAGEQVMNVDVTDLPAEAPGASAAAGAEEHEPPALAASARGRRTARPG